MPGASPTTDEHGWAPRPPPAADIQSIRRTLRQRTQRQKSPAHGVKPTERTARDRDFSRAILCAACGHRITSERNRIEAGGSYEHRFFNPHGILFHIGCFRSAGGCLTTGEANLDFTWFPGYAWRLALCRGCLQHLGWRFESSAGDSFFGLVLNRLVVEEHGT
jgi:hypothetical protein